jgi:hypothetical protein
MPNLNKFWIFPGFNRQVLNINNIPANDPIIVGIIGKYFDIYE